MSFRPDDLPFRYQDLSDQLARDVRDGRFPPGTRLPSVRSLCELHGASLATVTHALHRLEDAGLIEARPRQGFFACNRPPTKASPDQAVPTEALERRRERLMALAAAQPGQLSLSHLALPSDLLPLAALRRLTQARLRDGTGSWAEGSVAGSQPLREALAQRLARRGCRVQADDIVVTQGEGEALQLCLRQLTRPGDRVAVTRPVPLRVLEVMHSLGLVVVELPGQDGGEMAAALEALLRDGPVAACIADMALSAAMGIVWTDAGAQTLVSACTRHGLPLIEGDLLGELPIGTQALRPLKAFDAADRVLHCGSLACVTGTGLSVGWIASGRHRVQLRAARAVHGELLPALTDQVLTDFLTSDAADRHLRRLQLQLARRLRAWVTAVGASFPAGTVVRHGPFGHQLWVTLPDGVDVLRLLERARCHGIGFVPGAVFTDGTDFDACLRITTAHALEGERAQALTLLGQLASALMATDVCPERAAG